MKHILHAEDSESDVLLMRLAFERAKSGATYNVVRDGEDALAYLAGFGKYQYRQAYPKPNLLLLDLRLPILSGFEVLERIRTNPRFAVLPVVVLSSSVLDGDVRRAELLGANGYLAKTGNLRRLVEMVKAINNYWLADSNETAGKPAALPAFKVMI
jgi:CheY-like chemotaxis protein